jgi:hypothetical protein
MATAKTENGAYEAISAWIRAHPEDIYHAIHEAAKDAMYEWLSNNRDDIADVAGSAYARWLSENGTEAMAAAVIAAKDTKAARKARRAVVRANTTHPRIVHAILSHGVEHQKLPTPGELATTLGMSEDEPEFKRVMLDARDSGYVTYQDGNVRVTGQVVQANFVADRQGYMVATCGALSWPTVGVLHLV